jgi:hypothetical protein
VTAPLQPVDGFPADAQEIELLIAEIDDRPMWRILARALSRLAARQASLEGRPLDADLLRESMSLQNLCQGGFDQRIDATVRSAVWAYLMSLPGFDRAAAEKATDQNDNVYRAHQEALVAIHEMLAEIETVFGGGQRKLAKAIAEREGNMRGRVVVGSRPGSKFQTKTAWLACVAACAEAVRGRIGEDGPVKPEHPRVVFVADESAGLPDEDLIRRTAARLSAMRIALVVGSSRPIEWARSVITPDGVQIRMTSVPMQKG